MASELLNLNTDSQLFDVMGHIYMTQSPRTINLLRSEDIISKEKLVWGIKVPCRGHQFIRRRRRNKGLICYLKNFTCGT